MRAMRIAPLLLHAAALAALFIAPAIQAQNVPSASRAASSAASAPQAEPSQKIEVTGSRESDVEQRRQSTAAKIVIGREEIERFGDSTLGEVLKRLPGITLQGAPGRGADAGQRSARHQQTAEELQRERA